jgi:hypothetical protein
MSLRDYTHKESESELQYRWIGTTLVQVLYLLVLTLGYLFVVVTSREIH